MPLEWVAIRYAPQNHTVSGNFEPCITVPAVTVLSGKWLELEGGVISGLFKQPAPALERRGEITP